MSATREPRHRRGRGRSACDYNESSAEIEAATLSDDERVLGVIDAFYGAAMDEALWPDALEKLADLTGS
ncbi:MAG: hypothetical protein EA417_21530 [Gammaproteobacteria bacterium]|nr:MAG: hypothetical protein EA417_21530 [Gammaproteobacteria bacterium]